ncbi:MAG: type IV toxin-antitoxin system AbiEi family antitoxin domain-containing protein [Gemmatimonadota bacterium]
MKKISKVIWNVLLPRSPVFSTSEVAKLAGVEVSNAARDLARLERDGLVRRITRGFWAVPTHPDFSPYVVVPHLVGEPPGGYVSLLSALNLHGMIEQIPRVVHIVTTRQRSVLMTPVGTYEFYRIQEELFGGFKPYRRTGNFDIATPEKALFDTLYFSARKGRRFASLPEVELPDGFSVREFESWAAKINHPPLRTAIRLRWEKLVERLGVGQRG